MRLSIGGVSAGLGFALAVSGLVVGLLVGVRGMTLDTAVAPGIAVALVVTRGLIALGMLAFGCGLVFFATRLLLVKGEAPQPSPQPSPVQPPASYPTQPPARLPAPPTPSTQG